MTQKWLTLLAALLLLIPSISRAQNVTLLLFDGETGQQFAGCLNCNQYDDAAVCNQYGDFGSRYSDTSIWNQYGVFGSRYEDNSPWNRYGEGLRVVDPNGNYYGRFSLSRYGQSELPIILAILDTYEKIEALEPLRDLLCE